MPKDYFSDVFLASPVNSSPSHSRSLLEPPETSINERMSEKAIKKKRPTRRPSRNIPFLPGVRILRRDVRRKYGPMLLNVLNSHDGNLVRKFFEEYSSPLVEVRHLFPSTDPSQPPRVTSVTGVEPIIRSFLGNFLMVPDHIIRFSEMSVIQRMDESGSRVVAHTVCKGTMLYSVDKTGSPHRRRPSEGVQSEIKDSLRHESPAMTKLEKPLEFLMEGVMTIFLDGNHKMIGFHIHAGEMRNFGFK